MPRQAMVAWSWAVRQVLIPQGWLRACGRRGQSLVHSLAGLVVGEHGPEHGIGGGQVGLAHPVRAA
jgi:hypothetical protein